MVKTGDIGYIDKKGRLTISDRLKNMIIVSGFNVYPREVEICILKLDYVKEVAVTGVNSKASGERAIAFISLEKGSKATEDDIIQYCKEKLVSYKVPKSCIFVETLPKNNTGKIDIKKLKKIFIKLSLILARKILFWCFTKSFAKHRYKITWRSIPKRIRDFSNRYIFRQHVKPAC